MGTSVPPSRPDDIASIARRQLGLITRAQARTLSCSTATIRRRVAAGRWAPLAPAVYLINGAPVTWATRVLAAGLATGGVASHRTAAALLGLSGFPRGRVELTVARGSAGAGVTVPGARIHWSTDLDRAGVIRVDAIPITDPARLAVDLGAVVAAERFEAAVEEMVGRQLLTWDRALDSLLRHARRGRNGVGALRALLDERIGSTIAASALERAFIRLLSARGLPEPEIEHEVFDGAGFVARVDAAYPDRRLAIELDGYRWHASRDTFETDRRKRARLQAAGWQVLAFTWRMVMDDPDSVIRAMRAGLHPNARTA